MLSKTEKQSELIVNFVLQHYCGIIEAIYRFGKTRLGVMAVAKYITEFPKNDVLIVAPSQGVYTAWEMELIKEFGAIPKRVNLITMDSLLRVGNFDIGLLVIDEIHMYTTDKRYQVIDGTKVNFSHFLGLTGTMPTGPDYYKLTAVAPVIDTITEKEAEENGWISPSMTYNVALQFPNRDKLEYIKRSEPITNIQKDFQGLSRKFRYDDGNYMFRSDIDLITSCFRGKNTPWGRVDGERLRASLAKKMGWRPDLNLLIDYNRNLDLRWSPSAIKRKARNFINNVDYRQELMIDSNTKLSAVIAILEKFRDRQTIVFNGNINFAEAVKDSANHNIPLYSATTYHSQVKNRPLIDPITNEYFKYKSGAKKGQVKMFGQKKIIDDVVDGMTNGQYDMVSVVNAFDVGINIPTLDLVITTSGSANMINHKQRTARGKTFIESKVSLIINLFFDDFDVEIEGVVKSFNSRDRIKLQYREGVKELSNVLTLNEFLATNV